MICIFASIAAMLTRLLLKRNVQNICFIYMSVSLHSFRKGFQDTSNRDNLFFGDLTHCFSHFIEGLQFFHSLKM